MPSLSKKSSGRPKTPPLRTALRAQERKRFDNIVKEREMQREQARQMASLMYFNDVLFFELKAQIVMT